MEKVVWKGKIKPGKFDEYKLLHDKIWPEMTENLNRQGIHNYTIWNNGDELFGYYEVESIEHMVTIKSNSDIARRWENVIKDLVDFTKDPDTGENLRYNQIFYHR